jgi:acetyl-CoA C-acetyltransferase
MLTGPIPACRKILERNKMTARDIDLVEVNEAFAPVPMITMQEIGFPHDTVNVNGGAIALGHPLGATGAMLIGTLVDELERRDRQIGLTTMCIGLGMGIATIVERV